MPRHFISEKIAKAGIYLISALVAVAFVVFVQGARGYSSATAASPASSSGAQAHLARPPASIAAASSQGPLAASANSHSLPAISSLPATSVPDSLPALADSTPAAQSGPAFVQTPDLDELPIDFDILFDELQRLGAMPVDLPSDIALQYVGEFHTTSYCCEVYPHICGGNGVTASGTVPTPGLTCAADWSVLPRYTWIYIEGVGIRRIEDTGSAIKGARLDVAVDTHQNALRWPGFGSHRVWVLAWGG